MSEQLTDIGDVLETAIDEAGRELVFSIMRAAGWRIYDLPPRWVWWEAVKHADQIVVEIRRDNTLRSSNDQCAVVAWPV